MQLPPFAVVVASAQNNDTPFSIILPPLKLIRKSKNNSIKLHFTPTKCSTSTHTSETSWTTRASPN